MLRDPSRMLIVGLVRTWVDFGDIGEPSRGVALGDKFRATLTQGKEQRVSDYLGSGWVRSFKKVLEGDSCWHCEIVKEQITRGLL